MVVRPRLVPALLVAALGACALASPSISASADARTAHAGGADVDADAVTAGDAAASVVDSTEMTLGWASHGSENGWHSRTGDYAGTVEALLAAGAKPPAKLQGSPAVREVLRRHGVSAEA